MITGDQALTACHVASQVHIISKPTLILTHSSTGGFDWLSPDESERVPFRYTLVGVPPIEFDVNLVSF
jgi:manganese-transporting P-type ATPase